MIKTRDEILARVKEVAVEINRDYSGKELEIVCLTNAAMDLVADLVKQLDITVRVHPFAFSAYKSESDKPSGEVQITLDLPTSIKGKHVLVVEGMVISGATPGYLMKYFQLREPESLALCVIGSKPKLLKVKLDIRYQLFSFESEWVTGYGIGASAGQYSAELMDMR